MRRKILNRWGRMRDKQGVVLAGSAVVRFGPQGHGEYERPNYENDFVWRGTPASFHKIASSNKHTPLLQTKRKRTRRVVKVGVGWGLNFIFLYKYVRVFVWVCRCNTSILVVFWAITPTTRPQFQSRAFPENLFKRADK